MKNLLVTLASASLVATAMQASAEDIGNGLDLSMNVGVVSDYLFRGISQTDNHGAIQGGMDLSAKDKDGTGFYVGTWLSSLNPGFASTEQDLYGGYGYAVNSDISLDVHYIRYVYASSPVPTNPSFSEVHGGITAYGATLGIDYSADVPTIGNTLNYSLGYSYGLPMDITLAATAGHYDFNKTDTGAKPFVNKDAYTYWNIGVSKKLGGVTWGLSYNDTNLSGTDCAGFAAAIGGDKYSCGPQFVLSATKAL